MTCCKRPTSTGAAESSLLSMCDAARSRRVSGGGEEGNAERSRQSTGNEADTAYCVSFRSVLFTVNTGSTYEVISVFSFSF